MISRNTMTGKRPESVGCRSQDAAPVNVLGSHIRVIGDRIVIKRRKGCKPVIVTVAHIQRIKSVIPHHKIAVLWNIPGISSLIILGEDRHIASIL